MGLESNIFLGKLEDEGVVYGEGNMKVNQRIDISQEGDIKAAENIVDIDDQPWTIGKNVLGGRVGNDEIANINGGEKLVYPTQKQIFNKRYKLKDQKLVEVEGNIIDTMQENTGWNVGDQDILKLRNAAKAEE